MWLDAQRRFADADNHYYLALCDHQIALKNVNYEKGSLLDYCNVQPVNGLSTTATDSVESKQPMNTANSDAIEVSSRDKSPSVDLPAAKQTLNSEATSVSHELESALPRKEQLTGDDEKSTTDENAAE